MTARNLRATYNTWSSEYDDTPNPLIAVEEPVVRSLLKTMEFDRVLDAATGTGRYAIYMAERGKRVSAVDDNGKMLVVAKKKALARQLSIDFRRENISHLSFEDSSFDLVICALVLSHIKNLDLPCRELVRVLKRGGHLVISDLHPEAQATMGPEHKELIQGEERFFPTHHFHVDDYLKAVELAGAEVLDAIDIPMETQRGWMSGGLVIRVKKVS